MSWKSKDLSRLLIRPRLKPSIGLSRPSSRPRKGKKENKEKQERNKKKPKGNQEKPREKSKSRLIQGISLLAFTFLAILEV